MKTPKIALVGLFDSEAKTAAYDVMHTIARVLKNAHCEVDVLPYLQPSSERKAEPQLWEENGIKWICLPRPGKKIPKVLMNVAAVNDPVIKWLSSPAHHYTHILTYSGNCGFLFKLIQICRARNIPLINYVVEWYDPSHTQLRPLLGGLHEILDSEVQRRFINRFIKNHLCISSYLFDYYRKYGCNCFLYPQHIIDFNDLRYADLRIAETAPSREVNLLFCGSFQRERWDVIIQGMAILKKEGIPVKIALTGSTEEKFLKRLAHLKTAYLKVKDQFVFHGWVPRERVRELMQNASYALLLRDDKRWSKACFPSKMSEFLACGTPIISNCTSDLCEYISDGYNGLIIKRAEVDCFVETVRRAHSISRDRYQELRMNARNSAYRFDFNRWAESLSQFVLKAVS